MYQILLHQLEYNLRPSMLYRDKEFVHVLHIQTNQAPTSRAVHISPLIYLFVYGGDPHIPEHDPQQGEVSL